MSNTGCPKKFLECKSCKNVFCGECHHVVNEVTHVIQVDKKCQACYYGPPATVSCATADPHPQPANEPKPGPVSDFLRRTVLRISGRNKKNPEMARRASMPDLKSQVSGGTTDKQRTDNAVEPSTGTKFALQPTEQESVAVTSVEAAEATCGNAVHKQEECVEERNVIAVTTECTETQKHVLTSTYGVKTSNTGSSFGKGLCAIIHNFTIDLEHYSKDVQGIRTFFKDKLECDILDEYYNLSHEKFDEALEDIALQLNRGEYDRFFCFILSHGCEKGIVMSLDGDGSKEEPEKEYPIEKMVEKFSHDKVKRMKCYPKCFFIQACRGYDMVKPAAQPCDSQPDNEAENIYRGPVAVGADILLAFPCNYGNPSYVVEYGSWYLQETMRCLNTFYENEHLVDIMTEVSARVSKRVGKLENDKVAQMPHISSTLTKKFHLKIDTTKIPCE